MRGKCEEQNIPENRVFEEQKSIEQEAQNVAIAVKMVNLYHALLCLARGQLKLSAVSCCPDGPPIITVFRPLENLRTSKPSNPVFKADGPEVQCMMSRNCTVGSVPIDNSHHVFVCVFIMILRAQMMVLCRCGC